MNPETITIENQELIKRHEIKDTPFTIVEIDGEFFGAKGERLKSVGIAARSEIEKKLKGKIFLGLHVKVMPNWQSDAKALSKLGFTQQ